MCASSVAEERRPVCPRRVGVDDLDVRTVADRLAEPRQERAIELDRQDPRRARDGERGGQRPEPRPDLEHLRARTDLGVAGDRRRQVRVEQEVLTERFGRVDAGGRRQGSW